MYPLVQETHRRALIRRFPYAVFFECEEAAVTVYAMFHSPRDPEKWRQRLPWPAIHAPWPAGWPHKGAGRNRRRQL